MRSRLSLMPRLKTLFPAKNFMHCIQLCVQCSPCFASSQHGLFQKRTQVPCTSLSASCVCFPCLLVNVHFNTQAHSNFAMSWAQHSVLEANFNALGRVGNLLQLPLHLTGHDLQRLQHVPSTRCHQQCLRSSIINEDRHDEIEQAQGDADK